MGYFEKGKLYPPVEHQARIERYRVNKRLFEGRHHEVFTEYNLNNNDTIYVAMNVASLICKKGADLLFGETLRVLSKNGNDAQQLAFNEMVENNNINILNYESALSNAFRGDSFYKIRYGQEYGGLFQSHIDPYRVIIENQNPMYVFPATSPFDANKFEHIDIAVPVQKNGDWILDVEEHHPGYIESYQVKMQPTITKSGKNRDMYVTEWKLQEEIPGTRETTATGIPSPLVVHIPNYSTDSSWEGIDDLTEITPLIDELNNRLTQIASILDKHADPALALPNGTIGEDEDGNVFFNVSVNKVFEIDGNDDVMPQYITWNGQLQQAFEEIKLLLKQIYTIAEIPAVVLGDGESGTSGNSGLAIQMQMNTLLSKINRKKRYYDAGLRKVFLIAQLMEEIAGESNYDMSQPRLVFRSGLPKDYVSEANVLSTRSGGKQTKSLKSLLMEHDGMTDLEAEAEIARIAEEGKIIEVLEKKNKEAGIEPKDEDEDEIEEDEIKE